MLPVARLSFLSILLLPLLAMECEKEEVEPTPVEQLPPTTQSGEDTFGVLLNGEPWETESSYDLLATYQQGFLDVRTDLNKDGYEAGVELVINGFIEEGKTYDLISPPDSFLDFHLRNISTELRCYYNYDNTLDGSVTITRWDPEEQIVSGTFSFTTATEGCDTVRATNGRFDVRFTY